MYKEVFDLDDINMQIEESIRNNNIKNINPSEHFLLHIIDQLRNELQLYKIKLNKALAEADMNRGVMMLRVNKTPSAEVDHKKTLEYILDEISQLRQLVIKQKVSKGKKGKE